LKHQNRFTSRNKHDVGAFSMPQTPPVPRLTLDLDPPADLRAELGRRIDAFHDQTVPFQSNRFTLRLDDPDGGLVGGLSGVLSWGWLFVHALWVDEAARGQGAGRTLMARAERHAAARGCHAAWLDTFQARGFYEAIGYTVFGTLEDYPEGQTRYFLRKPLERHPADRES
jgi:ribosomal protein S18 acetylase RimI-like enzyme